MRLLAIFMLSPYVTRRGCTRARMPLRVVSIGVACGRQSEVDVDIEATVEASLEAALKDLWEAESSYSPNPDIPVVVKQFPSIVPQVIATPTMVKATLDSKTQPSKWRMRKS